MCSRLAVGLRRRCVSDGSVPYYPFEFEEMVAVLPAPAGCVDQDGLSVRELLQGVPESCPVPRDLNRKAHYLPVDLQLLDGGDPVRVRRDEPDAPLLRQGVAGRQFCDGSGLPTPVGPTKANVLLPLTSLGRGFMDVLINSSTASSCSASSPRPTGAPFRTRLISLRARSLEMPFEIR